MTFICENSPGYCKHWTYQKKKSQFIIVLVANDSAQLGPVASSAGIYVLVFNLSCLPSNFFYPIHAGKFITQIGIVIFTCTVYFCAVISLLKGNSGSFSSRLQES